MKSPKSLKTSLTLTKQINAILPVLIWMALIFKLSSGSVPSASIDYWTDFAVKKTGHVLLFGILALLIYRAFIIYGYKNKNSAWASVLLSFLYGGTDEYHQSFTQGRGPHIRDVFIDGLGALLVISVLYYMPPKVGGSILQILEKLNLK